MIAALTFCLSMIVSDEEREDRLGDLAEAYAQYERSAGAVMARRLHRRDLCSSILAIGRRRAGTLCDESAAPATLAILVALTGFAVMFRAAADPWWAKSGFDRNPGYFETYNQIDYPVCRGRRRSWKSCAALRAPPPRC